VGTGELYRQIGVSVLDFGVTVRAREHALGGLLSSPLERLRNGAKGDREPVGTGVATRLSGTVAP
jgi:hypothetical protein